MPMTTFQKAWAGLGTVEKGFVNHPSDSGGATNHGITERMARAHGYVGTMESLPESFAVQLAKAEFWDVMKLDSIYELVPGTALEMFEAGFLCGPPRVSGWLQTELNRMNQRAAYWRDIPVDGRIGAVTLRALEAYLNLRGRDGDLVLYTCMNCAQWQYLAGLVDRREKDEAFYYGWILKRVVPEQPNAYSTPTATATG